MEKIVSATEARVRFGELLRQVVEEQRVVIVERGGKPQAVVLSLAEYESLKRVVGKAGWRERLAEAERLRRQIASRRGGQSLTAAEAVIDQTRNLRDEQLDGLR